MKRQRGDNGVAGRKAGSRRPNDAYWVLRIPQRDCFVCESFGKDEYGALCVFDSRAAAEEYLLWLNEPLMFLDTLEQYRISTPSWVHRETLLPEACEISRLELWEAIEDVGVGYVAINPPPEGVEEETFELWPSRIFEAE